MLAGDFWETLFGCCIVQLDLVIRTLKHLLQTQARTNPTLTNIVFFIKEFGKAITERHRLKGPPSLSSLSTHCGWKLRTRSLMSCKTSRGLWPAGKLFLRQRCRANGLLLLLLLLGWTCPVEPHHHGGAEGRRGQVAMDTAAVQPRPSLGAVQPCPSLGAGQQV